MKLTVLLASLVLLSAPLHALGAQDDARDTARYDLGADALAMRGFDPVAAFPEGGGAAREGLAEHSLAERGVVYRFTTREHRAWFRAEPGRYEPAHGGWCSRAMAAGRRVPADPRHFVAAGGRLFLFADADARAQWLEGDFVSAADASWKEHSGEGPRGVRERAEVDPEGPEWQLVEKGAALSGYDPVSYFPEGGSEPRKGDRELALQHAGVTYRFANERNRELFRAQPDRYRARYGGWCAYAMAQGEKVEVDPESFLVTDGRLYLFYKGFLNDTRKKWLKDTRRLHAEADRHWLALVTR